MAIFERTRVKMAKENQKTECNDKNCPFHGKLSTRGRKFKGRVISAKMDKTAIISWPYTHKVPKFERYERRTTKVAAHVPSCLSIHEGDEVEIAECRPIAKTVKFVVLRKCD